MVLDEMIRLFLDSRRRGHSGAKVQATKKTLEIYETMLRHFHAFLHDRPEPIGRYESIRRVHFVELDEWVKGKIDRGDWKKSTSISFYKVLRVFFRWVDKDEDCRIEELKGLQRYLPVIPKMPARTFIPETKELRQFKNGFNTNTIIGYRNYAAICLMLTNGMRVGEVCNLRLDQVKLEDRTVIASGKTGPRLVPITTEMVRILRMWIRKRATFKKTAKSPYLFISSKEEQMTPNAFAKAFKYTLSKLPIEGKITPHTLRHTFATLYLREGGNMERLRNIMGHTSYEMLRTYLHNANVGSKDSLEELERVNVLKQV